MPAYHRGRKRRGIKQRFVLLTYVCSDSLSEDDFISTTWSVCVSVRCSFEMADDLSCGILLSLIGHKKFSTDSENTDASSVFLVGLW